MQRPSPRRAVSPSFILAVCSLFSAQTVSAFVNGFCAKSHLLRSRLPLRTRVSSTTSMAHSFPPCYSGPLCSEKKAVIFDIDGTLADSFNLAFAATNDVLTRNGFPAVDEDEYHFGSRFTTPVRLARHAGLDPEKDGANFQALGAKLGQEFDELYIGLVDPAKGNAGFYPGIGKLISDIPESVKVGALTNAAVAYAEQVLKKNGVRGRFAVVHGADDVAAPKPAPDGLLQCCAELGVAAEDVVYVGDSPSDGAAARAAGCSSLSVTWGANTAAALARSSDGMVATVSHLSQALFGVRYDKSSVPNAPETKLHVRPHVLLDRDGVINVDVGAPGVIKQSQLQLLPGVAEAVWKLKEAGSRVSIVTNQNALAKGVLSASGLADIHHDMLQQLKQGRPQSSTTDTERREEDVVIDAIFFATGEPEKSRGVERGGVDAADSALSVEPQGSLRGFALKPAGDLPRAALALAGSDPAEAALVGDNYRDLVAGLRAGVKSLHLVVSSPYGIQAREWLEGGAGAAALEAEMAGRFGVSETERAGLRAHVRVHRDLAACVQWMLAGDNLDFRAKAATSRVNGQ